MPNILLTGSSGWVGKKLCNRLSEDYAVSTLDTLDYNEFVSAIKDFKKWGYRYEAVIHCGAISDSSAQDNLLWQMNYQATRDLTDFCRDGNFKMIFISSCAAQAPDIPYGWSKYIGEEYVRHSGIHNCILRPCNIWGFDEGEKKQPSIVYKTMTRTLPVVYEGCVRDFVYVEDVLDGIISVVEQWVPGMWELGTAEPTEIANLVENLYGNSIFGRPPLLNECPITPRRVANADYLLPNWNFSPLSRYMEEITEFFLIGA